MKEINIWWENPKILLDKNHILDIFPKQHMTFNEKINALSRLILITILIYCIFIDNYQLLLLLLFTVIIIYIYFNNSRKTNSPLYKESNKKEIIKEMKPKYK